MNTSRLPEGWDKEHVRRLLDHYESLSEDEQVAEDEAALDREGQTVVSIPNRLLPQVRKLLSETAKT